MRRALSMLLLLAGLCAAGCATPSVLVPDQDRLRVAREIAGRKRWLKVAVNVGPFFGDGEKLLCSDQPFTELELLESPGGETIAPPKPERILPPGTPVVIRDVEFPAPWGNFHKRVLMTPRWLAWAYLEVPGETRPAIIVLPQTIASFEDVRVELERYLGTSDPSAELSALSEGQRKAVARKEVTEGMGPQAVTMAWGYPEKRVIDRPSAKEQWSWPGGKRRAWFEDERLVRFEGR